MKNTIRFFYFDRLIGKFDCPEMSNFEDREKIAIDNGVGLWTHFILGDNRIMGVRLDEHKKDLRGLRGEYSTADFLPLPTGEYLVWIEPNGMTVTIKKE